jgi:UDP-N-acetyl-D-galactosamine dehydrogenase
VIDLNKRTLGVVGLGYVGLPLAVEFSKQFRVVGFDIDPERIADLGRGHDATGELTEEAVRGAGDLTLTFDESALADCDVYIVAVPTPINEHKWPDLYPLREASRLVGRQLSSGNLVVYESTVYPGATEEICIPILELTSNLSVNQDFFVGYSPERVNPGDRQHGVADIVKLTSGSTPEAAQLVDQLYRRIITAGTFKAASIQIAEAAKVIENVQRDVNIALINELAQIFHRVGLDTQQVLEAAATKWNFLPFRPGLVGGHCIGVDPYYLAHKAQAAGYQPSIIPASRQVNESMGEYVADRVLRLMAAHDIPAVGARILILGLSFKENCPDLRNTKVIDIARGLLEYHAQIDIHDPRVDRERATREYGLHLIDTPNEDTYDAVVIAVAHDEFRELGAQGIRRFGKKDSVVFDVKHLLAQDEADGRL